MTFLWKVDNQLLDNWIEGHDRVLIEMWYVFLWHKLRQFFEHPIYYNTIYVSSCAAQDECVHVLASSKGQARCKSAQHAARHTVCLHLHSLINKYPRLLDRWNSTLTLACLSEYNKNTKMIKIDAFRAVIIFNLLICAGHVFCCFFRLQMYVSSWTSLPQGGHRVPGGIRTTVDSWWMKHQKSSKMWEMNPECRRIWCVELRWLLKFKENWYVIQIHLVTSCSFMEFQWGLHSIVS